MAHIINKQDYSNQNFLNQNLSNSHFINCNFNNVNWNSCNFTDCIFTNSNNTFVNVTVKNSNLSNATIKYIDLNQVTIDNTNILTNITLDGCILSPSFMNIFNTAITFKNLDIGQSYFNNLNSVNFNSVCFKDINFNNVDLTTRNISISAVSNNHCHFYFSDRKSIISLITNKTITKELRKIACHIIRNVKPR